MAITVYGTSSRDLQNHADQGNHKCVALTASCAGPESMNTPNDRKRLSLW